MDLEEECISKLQTEVSGLHASLQPLLVTAGSVQAASWKYPDKQATELDVKELLQLFVYFPDDDRKSQASHVVLLELVIDRLLLLLQATTHLFRDNDCNANKEIEEPTISAIVNSYCSEVTKVSQKINQHISTPNSPSTNHIDEAIVNDNHISDDESSENDSSDDEEDEEEDDGIDFTHEENNLNESNDLSQVLPKQIKTEASSETHEENEVNEEENIDDDPENQDTSTQSDAAVNTSENNDQAILNNITEYNPIEILPRLRDRESLAHAQEEAKAQAAQEAALAFEGKFDKRKCCPTCGQKPIRRRRYECLFCDKTYTLRKQLDTHERKFHPEEKRERRRRMVDKKIQTRQNEGDIEVEEGTHECPTCNKVFKGEKHLQRHIRARHRDPDEPETPKKRKKLPKLVPEEDGRFKCKECNKTFKTKRIIRKHMQIHTGEYQYKCKECGKGYYNVGSYRAHLSLHTGEKYYFCKLCGKGFPHSSSYNFHVRTSHSTEQNFECAICSRKYKCQKYLNDHMQSVHLQPDRYNCQMCGRTFGHRASLFMHLKTHRKERGEEGAEKEKKPKKSAPKAPPVQQPTTEQQPIVRDYNMPLIKQIRNYVYPQNKEHNFEDVPFDLSSNPSCNFVMMGNNPGNFLNYGDTSKDLVGVPATSTGLLTNPNPAHVLQTSRQQVQQVNMPQYNVSTQPSAPVFPPPPMPVRAARPQQQQQQPQPPPPQQQPQQPQQGNSELTIPPSPLALYHSIWGTAGTGGTMNRDNRDFTFPTHNNQPAVANTGLTPNIPYGFLPTSVVTSATNEMFDAQPQQ